MEEDSKRGKLGLKEIINRQEEEEVLQKKEKEKEKRKVQDRVTHMRLRWLGSEREQVKTEQDRAHFQKRNDHCRGKTNKKTSFSPSFLFSVCQQETLHVLTQRSNIL